MTDLIVKDEVFIRKLKEIILANLGDVRFGVNELARESGLGYHQLSQKIFTASKRKANQFINEVRLQKAHEMLINEEFTASEIAYRTGFSSPAYFNTCFHDFFGYPPGKARYINLKSTEDNIQTVNVNSLASSEVHTKAFLDEKKQNKKENSIAVLPFVDMSKEKDQGYFCDGMTEEIINALVHIRNLKVIARTSSFAFSNKQIDIREIGRTLNVETVLEGSIRKEGDHIRITAQLISVEDGLNIWSERYDCDLKEVFAIQDEISMAIADKMKINLSESDKVSTGDRHTKNLEAYNLYLKGCFFWQTLTFKGFGKAVDYYEQALIKDPDYALVYTGLASLTVQNSFHGNSPPNIAYPKAINYLEKALNIDDTLAEAYSTLGTIDTFFNWDWGSAESNFHRALQLKPNSPLIHLFYSFFLTCTRRIEEAIDEIKFAQELDPLSVYINSHLGIAYSNLNGQYDKAIEEFLTVISINPNYHFAHLHLGNAYYGKSMLKEASAEYEKAVSLSDDLPYASAFLASCCYLMGDNRKADKLLESIRKKAETQYIPPMSFYLIHKIRGEEDLAFEWFRKACSGHDSFLLWFLVSPFFNFESKRYKLLLAEAGLEI
jgi:TolB-like protein